MGWRKGVGRHGTGEEKEKKVGGGYLEFGGLVF